DPSHAAILAEGCPFRMSFDIETDGAMGRCDTWSSDAAQVLLQTSLVLKPSPESGRDLSGPGASYQCAVLGVAGLAVAALLIHELLPAAGTAGTAGTQMAMGSMKVAFLWMWASAFASSSVVMPLSYDLVTSMGHGAVWSGAFLSCGALSGGLGVLLGACLDSRQARRLCVWCPLGTCMVQLCQAWILRSAGSFWLLMVVRQLESFVSCVALLPACSMWARATKATDRSFWSLMMQVARGSGMVAGPLLALALPSPAAAGESQAFLVAAALSLSTAVICSFALPTSFIAEKPLAYREPGLAPGAGRFFLFRPWSIAAAEVATMMIVEVSFGWHASWSGLVLSFVSAVSLVFYLVCDFSLRSGAIDESTVLRGAAWSSLLGSALLFDIKAFGLAGLVLGDLLISCGAPAAAVADRWAEGPQQWALGAIGRFVGPPLARLLAQQGGRNQYALMQLSVLFLAASGSWRMIAEKGTKSEEAVFRLANSLFFCVPSIRRLQSRHGDGGDFEQLLKGGLNSSSSSNPATYKKATMSSTAFLEGAFTDASRAVDGDYGGHLFFTQGCAITDWEANPWWSVDLESAMPMAVVRIYPRTDDRQFTMSGLQMRFGLNNNWNDNPVCASNIVLQTVGVTAVNCFAGGRYLFIGAPNTENARLAICEIDVVMRGPKEVKEYLGAIGRPLDIRVEGVGMMRQDQIRVVHPSILCGTPAADGMDASLVERTRPYGEPEVDSNELEIWRGVEFLKMGFFKVCWCSGMFSCNGGTDFTFLVGFAVVTGEMRTVAGDGKAPLGNTDDWEDLYSTLVGAVSGMALSDDGQTLFWSEPHRVRQASLENGTVRTIVGDLVAGNCVPPFNLGDVCGDGQVGTAARLNDPRGLSVCRGELLIADYLNSRIRAYNLETGIITTKAGTTHGYAGDGGSPHQAQLSGPLGVACDDLRGYWIADTGNSAIRGVRVAEDMSDVITTVVGGLGQGLAPPGTWNNQAQLDHPAQLAMSETTWGAPRSLVYIEQSNAVARFLPLGTRVMEGAVQEVIGTGAQGHRVTASNNNIELNNPEGIAVHSSTVFVADTQNHRIIMVPILEYEPLGCFKEITNEGDGTLVPSLEGDLEAGLSPGLQCSETVLNEPNAVARCAAATLRKGWDLFAVRCGGVCASALDANDWYRFNGASTLCEKGRGGLSANSVYRLVNEHAKDLLGKFYIIAGQAFTTEALQDLEPPRPGYFGDRLASWVSAMDQPSQMAASPVTRNLFFGDRGNNRVRVIFGSLGPQPQTQQFYCTNGLNCTLNVLGNGFSEKDHIAFSRDYFTDPIVCGSTRPEDQFPQVYNLAAWSRLFLSKDFELGRLTLPVVGQFIVCYCIGNVGKDCDVTPDFEFKAGRLHVTGPNAGTTIHVLAGVPFDLALFGSAFSLADRIRLIRTNETCGAAGNTSVNDMLPFVRAPGNSSLKSGLGMWDEGTETYQVWRDLIVEEASELKVCWCNTLPCPFDSFFQVEAMRLSVGGPAEKSQAVQAGEPFDLLVEGAGGFKAADRVRLQDASVPCRTPVRRADLEQALPPDAAPCEVSATSVRWCGVKIPLSSPSSLVACWSGALGGFEAVNSTGVAAVWLTVGSPPQVQGTPGPIYRRELPVAPLSDSSWPSYINSGTYNVSVHMYGRSAPGADSPGPVQVSICEMPSRCLAPLDLRELPEGEVSVDTTRTWSGTTLFPRGVLVTSLSTDPYLAEYVDVALHGQWRRFPLNRWLLMQDGHAENLWESYTPPPLPSAAPTDSLYTEGDRCGGCGLGTICRERPQTALELAKQGISLALATTAERPVARTNQRLTAGLGRTWPKFPAKGFRRIVRCPLGEQRQLSLAQIVAAAASPEDVCLPS
ncbi:unnamed protein product, partial [Effrenium voratum]